jgi:hypothetical protein
MFQPTLSPAFGVDYKSKKEVIAALEAGKDFLCNPHGSYINLEGVAQASMKNVSVRYKKMGSVFIFNVEETPNGLKVKDGYR